MCRSCWEEAGSPSQITVGTAVAAAAGELVYEHHAAGGGLHCLLDDWNVGDGFCVRYTGHDDHFSREQILTEDICGLAFKRLTETERYTALALLHGYIK